MASDAPVVLYRYDGSPFSDKIDNVLSLKGIPHYKVDVSMTPPRTELSDLLGLSYRRIPVLTIGNDVYCDTSLITSALERHFTTIQGYGTLFPPRKGGSSADTGMIKAFTMYYVDRSLFPLGAACLPYNKFPKNFIEDRSALQSANIDVDAMLARQPMVKSLLTSHMSLLEEQLADERIWLFDTEHPSLADISVHFFFAWILRFRGMNEVLSGSVFPKSTAWLQRVTQFLNQRQAENAAPCQKIAGDAAAKIIFGSPAYDSGKVGFDEKEAARLGLKLGSQVTVAPDDSGKTVLTYGNLIGLDREEVVLETRGLKPDVPAVRCHFPRLNFTIRSTPASGPKL